MNRLVFLLAFGFSLVARSGETPLQVGLSEVEPFAYSKEGAIHGIHYDILMQLSQKAHLKFNYTLYPHLRLVNMLESLNLDLTILFSKTCEANKSYEIQSTIYSIKPALFLKRSVSLSKKNLHVGIIRGTCVTFGKKVLKPEMIDDISDMSQGIKMINAGRLDGVCGLPPVVEAALKRNDPLKEKLYVVLTESLPYDAVLCRKKTLPVSVKRKLECAASKLVIPPLE
jgi:hypothetical protein